MLSQAELGTNCVPKQEFGNEIGMVAQAFQPVQYV